jgi:hypothetical protein
MTRLHGRPIHARTLTEFDHAHGPIYLFVLDAETAGHGWEFMANQIWGSDLPEDAKVIVDDLLKRARWMTTTGYKLLLAMDPTPRDQTLDGLVSSGAMAEKERAFLDSPEGEEIWPRARQ